MRFLVVFAIIVGVLWYFLRDKKELKKNKKSNEEMMVECSECGTFISVKEGIVYQNKCFCSKECFQKDRR